MSYAIGTVLSFTVRWNNAVSDQFVAGSGVRQGSCLSPAIFNVFYKCSYFTTEEIEYRVSS